MTDSPLRAPETPARGIFGTIIILSIARTAVNMTRRYTYTFVPGIARALGVADTSVQNAISLQGGLSVFSPLLGGLAERFGRKYVMVAAMLVMSALGFAGAAFPHHGVFLALAIGFGLGKTLFDPSALAYMGDRVPYHRRSLAIGASELSWGAALMIGAPLTGLLLERATLSAVFLMLALALLAGAVLILWFLPGDRPRGTVTYISPGGVWKAVRGNPAAMGAVGYTLCNSAANEMIFINYGIFMQDSFSLALTALGVVTIAIAAAEALGEVAVASFGDRFGPRRMVLCGAVVAAVCYALFPLFGTGLPVAIAGIFLLFLGFEIAVVAALPLYTELLPTARAAMLAAILGAGALGRLLGGLTGAFVYNSFGVAANSLVACGVLVVGVTLFWRAVTLKVEQPG